MLILTGSLPLFIVWLAIHNSLDNHQLLHKTALICTTQRYKRSTDFMFMLGLNETMDQLAMANSVRWCGHVFRKEDGHVLRRTLDFKVEGQGQKWRPKRTWKKQEESVKVGLRREDALC